MISTVDSTSRCRQAAGGRPELDHNNTGGRDTCLAGKRLGFFTSTVGMGGSEVLVADAVEAALRAGAHVVCWCPAHAPIRNLLALRAVVHSRLEFRDWPRRCAASNGEEPADRRRTAATRRIAGRVWRIVIPRAGRRLAGYLTEAKRFAVEIADAGLDLVFVNVDGSEAPALGARMGSPIPVVACYHLSLAPCAGGAVDRVVDWLLTTTTMWSGTQLIHTSERVRDQWCRRCKFPRSRTRVIYNGVDDRSIERASRTDYGVEDGDFVVCVPARLHPVKGHRYLLEALASGFDACQGLKVLICGDGEMRRQLEEQVDRLRLRERVRFLGWRTDLLKILSISDCAVLPSVVSENLSVAILEAGMAGKPAIVTDVGGMPEAVVHERTGLVVLARSPAALREAMLALARAPEWARQMGNAARIDALRRFTRERMMAEYVDVFSKLCGGRGVAESFAMQT